MQVPKADRLAAAVKDVLQNLKEDTRDCKSFLANGNTEFDTNKYYLKVVDRLRNNNCTLDDIINDAAATAQFREHARLNAVIEVYEKKKSSESKSESKSPYFRIALEIVSLKEKFWQLAAKIETEKNIPQIIAFTMLIRMFCASQGVSLKEVIQDTEVKEKSIFDSGRLQMAKLIYLRMKGNSEQRSYQQPPPENQNVDLERQYRREVRNLAQKHAQPGQHGLVTQVGVRDVLGDREALKQKLRKIMLAEHPDKNPNANRDLYEAAVALRDFQDRGVLNDYLEQMQNLRERSPDESTTQHPSSRPAKK